MRAPVRRDPIVIAGGGTAGHALPAVAVARALVSRGYAPEDIVFVGSRRGLETRLVAEAGFPLIALPGRGVVRRVSVDNLGAVAGLSVAVGRAMALLARRRPRVVLSVGGYASVPCALAAVLQRVPLVLAESNAVAGAANRMVGRFARAAAVAFAGTGLPREVLTGTPVRPEIVALARRDRAEARSEARASLGLPAGRTVVVVAGGSLGARRINEAVFDLVRRLWPQRSDVAIHHAVGSRDWTGLSHRLPTTPPDGLFYRAVEYESRMAMALAGADVFVGRAGGTTLAELTVMGLPSIMVPLPIAPDDHQSVGARRLVRAGAAVLVPDAEISAERLSKELGALVSDPDRRERMAGAARRLGRPDAAERVADLLEEYGRARR